MKSTKARREHHETDKNKQVKSYVDANEYDTRFVDANLCVYICIIYKYVCCVHKLYIYMYIPPHDLRFGHIRLQRSVATLQVNPIQYSLYIHIYLCAHTHTPTYKFYRNTHIQLYMRVYIHGYTARAASAWH